MKTTKQYTDEEKLRYWRNQYDFAAKRIRQLEDKRMKQWETLLEDKRKSKKRAS